MSAEVACPSELGQEIHLLEFHLDFVTQRYRLTESDLREARGNLASPGEEVLGRDSRELASYSVAGVFRRDVVVEALSSPHRREV